MRVFSYLYQRMLTWAAHRYAPYYLAIVSFLESSFFPLPPDIMLVSMGLARPKRAWHFAFITTIFSVLGGCLGYYLGYAFMQWIEPVLLQSSYATTYLNTQVWFDKYGIWIVIIAAFTPIPYKLFTLSAGATHMVLGPFIMGSIIGRGARYFIVAWFLYVFGEKFEKHFRQWIDWIGWTILILIALYLMFGCGPRPEGLAPVVESSWSNESHKHTQFHKVSPGETLYAIAFRYDRDYHDLAKTNNLQSPYTLRVGQTIKLEPAQINLLSKLKQVQSLNPFSNLSWSWPIQGAIKAYYNPQKGQKGINIKGIKGDQVFAAESGVVAYAGEGLPGYGKLILIKHEDQFLSAYGFNQKIKVKEGQHIKRGQIIAQVGIVDRQYWGIHFEIRKQGEPVNPLQYLKKT